MRLCTGPPEVSHLLLCNSGHHKTLESINKPGESETTESCVQVLRREGKGVWGGIAAECSSHVSAWYMCNPKKTQIIRKIAYYDPKHLWGNV